MESCSGLSRWGCVFLLFKERGAYERRSGLVGAEMCIRVRCRGVGVYVYGG